MKKVSLAAAFAASLSLGSMPVCQAAEGAPVEDTRAAEEQVLDSADDDARFLAYRPFTREIAASVVVKTSLDQALADSGVLIDEARVAEEQPLGAADEEARFFAYQPFTREIASSVVASTSLERALAGSGVPADEARAAEEQLLGAADEAARFLADQPFARQSASSVVASTSPDHALADSGVPADEARVAEEQPLGAANDEARFLADQPFTRESASTAVVSTSPDQALAGSGVPVDEARVAEEQLLGAADEEARFLAYQPFTREIASSVVASTSLERALADSGVPAATLLEALRAFSATVNLERDVKRGDRLYVRYEQAFTAEGAAIGVGRVMWAELTLASRGPVAIHRFRTHDKVERLWFANGLSATPPALRMPLDVVSMSSGFGLRADPFDQPPPLAATGKSAPMGGPLRTKPLPPGLPTGSTSGNGGPVNMATPLGASLGFAPYAGFGSAAPKAKASQALFMHEGIDLVAPAGTPVYAAADGVVVGAAPNGRYGNWIRIEHGDKLATVYGHLMVFAPGIEPGESVVRGELIGFVGSTGRSTGAHLHFEVLNDGKPVNPITHPELKTMQLRGLDLERFRKQAAHSLEERLREEKVASSGF